jgi:hypothetical protein
MASAVEAIRRELALYLGRRTTIPVGIRPLSAIDCYVRTPEPGMRVFVTAGLSAFPMKQADKGVISQELLFACRGEHDHEIIGLLGVIAEDLVTRGRPLERGEVLGPADCIVLGSALTSLVATIPVFLPDRAVLYPGKPPTVLTWLVPLSTAEAVQARRLGPAAFEPVLEKIAESADLYDLGRRGVSG